MCIFRLAAWVADKTTIHALSVGKDGWVVVPELIGRDSHTLSLMISTCLWFSKVSGCLGAKTSKLTPGFSNLGAKASGYL